MTAREGHDEELEATFAFDSDAVPNEYIVKFKAYHPIAKHERLVRRAVDGRWGRHWRIVPRNNPAMKYPSDFALVQIDAKVFEAMQHRLLGSELIASVTPQRMVTRKTLETREPAPREFSRRLTRFSFEGDDEDGAHAVEPQSIAPGRRLLQTDQVTAKLEAGTLWEQGFTGKGVRVAVFDTGLQEHHPHFRNVEDRTNWTDEDTLEDGIGHGTFVAGVIASQTECLGFAPDATLHIFRVFTNRQSSYTSWFLDAFNYAIYSKVNILNLSIGGPDFLDRPFVEKVWELSANNVIVVSAIGNDGPAYGTLNNPADQMDVIGVGGIDHYDKMAPFSSRGMTTWELPQGYGRVKPDLVAYGLNVKGSRTTTGCRALSGTSVASPVVAGAVALLASVVPEEIRWSVINPASMKQALVESAVPIANAHIYEQGYGRLNVLGAAAVLQNSSARATVTPASLDLTREPYMWPFHTQPIYHTMMPTIINTTVLNSMAVFGEIETEPVWVPGENGELLKLTFAHAESLWPWAGWLAIYVTVLEEGKGFEGVASGSIRVSILSLPEDGGSQVRRTIVEVPLRVNVIPTPPREQRVLWDQFHNLRYPSGYFPRDSLWVKSDILDWTGDHPHTNFRDFYGFLRSHDYFLEVLGEPFTCFDPNLYGTLLLVDSEEEFYPEEVAFLKLAIEEHGLSVIVMAEWYSEEMMRRVKFFDDNTRLWWSAETGGGNVPALNDLLAPYGIALGEGVLEGKYELGSNKEMVSQYDSGSRIVEFPAGGVVVKVNLVDELATMVRKTQTEAHEVAIAGLYQTPTQGGGRIVVYGDSSCIDGHHQRAACYPMMRAFLRYTMAGEVDRSLFPESLTTSTPYRFKEAVKPRRAEETQFAKLSKVVNHPLVCGLADVHHLHVQLVIPGDAKNIWLRAGEPRTDQSNIDFPDEGADDEVSLSTLVLGLMVGMVVATAWLAIKRRVQQNQPPSTEEADEDV